MSSELRRLSSQLRKQAGATGTGAGLTSLTAKARRNLAESTFVKPARKASRSLAESSVRTEGRIAVKDPSKDVAGDSLKAANGFRDAIKGGDKLEEVATEVAALAKEAATAGDPQTAKRAAMDVEAATVKMKQAVDSIYGAYAEARNAFYAISLAWDMYKPPATAKKGPSSDVKALSEKELAEQIAFASKTLQTNVKDFLEKSATASKHFRNAAKKLGLEQGELSEQEKQDIIDAAFAARTASEPLFGRVQGIARRAVELVSRAKAKEKYEAKAKGVKIELSVEEDPELGGLDII